MQVGDKVTLKATSEFFDPTGEDEFNPFGAVGSVTGVMDCEPALYIIVDWQCQSSGPFSGQCTNSYNPEDLELI